MTLTESRMTVMHYEAICACVLLSYLLHALGLTILEFIMFKTLFSKMQHEAVWKASRISVGSAADIVKLTHYKWICNPRVDLNCVYCHGRCVCSCMRM